MGGDEGGSPYRLTFNQWLRDRLRYLIELTIMFGSRDQFVRALAEIETALGAAPAEWGDPIRHLSGMRMTQYRRVYQHILVYYTVHDIEPVVWLTAVNPLRKSAFWAGEG